MAKRFHFNTPDSRLGKQVRVRKVPTQNSTLRVNSEFCYETAFSAVIQVTDLRDGSALFTTIR